MVVCKNAIVILDFCDRTTFEEEATMTPETATRVLRAGAGIKVKAMSSDTLVMLATVAKQHKVRLEIKGSLTPDTMVRIANAGTGYVFFDTSDD
jgi:ABC-type proline/glycine betaine transport system substrate-binding protein